MIQDTVRQMRPRQWTKNLLLFAGVIFAERLLDVPLLLRAAAGFAVFCMAASSIYCINDLADLEADRLHPEKRNRPLPAGRISPAAVRAMGAGLLVTALVAAWLLAPAFAVVVALYFVMNLAYSLRLKRTAILDVILLAMGFVLRAVGSVEVLATDEVLISPWLLLCTFFLAMFIGAGKRRTELALLEADAAGHRPALAGYSIEFIDRIITITLTAAIMSYSIYTLAPGTAAKFGTQDLVYTVPYVVFGLLRYLYLVYERKVGGNPTEAILQDRPLTAAVGLWILTVCAILYRSWWMG
jgi:4-hydroxybenzoate polyprenyltransferase